MHQRVLCVPEDIMCTRGYYVYQRVLCVPEDLKMLGKCPNVGLFPKQSYPQRIGPKIGPYIGPYIRIYWGILRYKIY